MWKEINNEKDLKEFMDMIYGFHDSCIKEFKYISGAYVTERLSMHAENDKRVLRLIIQRQFENPCAIEMEFTGLIRLSVFPKGESHTCEILDATMMIKDDCIYWCDMGDLTEEDLNTYKGTIICASSVRWRACDKCIGKEEIYVGSKLDE